ncbi:AAA family ATPase [Chondromyces crocatus]|uniref:ATPase AAA-type core domain-containing protein n=1 Tax=Chondromyces crocatus TaxID=52 RepID=A0A0K1EMZ1_CHOCO|nr:AAA family ATPase [Chondromyces crocatus]AKT42214.1 uncharacterized protein CMC5_064370 [Chondromyces crocatus]
MKVQRVSVDGFRGLPDKAFPFIDPSNGRAGSLVVVTGATGSGKTSLLEAIIAGKEKVAAYGPMRPDTTYVRPGAGAAKVKIVWELSDAERGRTGLGVPTLESEAMFGGSLTPPVNDPALSAVLGEYSLDPASSKIEYFHATRRMNPGQPVDATQLSGGLAERALRLTRDDGKFSALVKYIVAAGLGLDVDAEGQPRQPGRVTAAFAKLCSTKKLAGLYRVGDGVFPGFQDKAGRALGLTQLSDGELDALLFAASFVRNGIRNSVVLVDTPELHRSDTEAREFVEGLLSLEEDNQLVVATRSPAVIGMVPRDLVVQLG